MVAWRLTRSSRYARGLFRLMRGDAVGSGSCGPNTERPAVMRKHQPSTVRLPPFRRTGPRPARDAPRTPFSRPVRRSHWDHCCTTVALRRFAFASGGARSRPLARWGSMLRRDVAWWRRVTPPPFCCRALRRTIDLSPSQVLQASTPRNARNFATWRGSALTSVVCHTAWSLVSASTCCR